MIIYKIEEYTIYTDFCKENYGWIKDLVRESMCISDKCKPRILTASQIGLITYFIGGEKPSVEVFSFIKSLCGVTREEGTASDYLYSKLYNSKTNKEPLNFYWVLGMSIKAWNYYTSGNVAVKWFKFSINDELPEPNKI